MAKTLKYIGEGQYSGDQDGVPFVVKKNAIQVLSDEKANYLLNTFPKNWEDVNAEKKEEEVVTTTTDQETTESNTIDNAEKKEEEVIEASAEGTHTVSGEGSEVIEDSTASNKEEEKKEGD